MQSYLETTWKLSNLFPPPRVPILVPSWQHNHFTLEPWYFNARSFNEEASEANEGNKGVYVHSGLFSYLLSQSLEEI